MIVQAGGVRGMLRLDQHEEREALGVLEATGRQAMGELRRTLGLLRDGAGPELAPPPRLEHLDGLVDGVRRTGLRVRLRVDGTPRPLAPGIELSAFRVVQEALTNAVRHAEAESADVLLRYGERALEIDVSDDGRGVVASNGSTGHGLAGMRERVAVLGGELEAGPGHDGGFRVHALLPVRDARA
jgi:signal transduction histidine kinase